MKILAALDKSDNWVNNIITSIINKPFGDSAIGNLDVWSYNPKQWDNGRIQLGELINQYMKNIHK